MSLSVLVGLGALSFSAIQKQLGTPQGATIAALVQGALDGWVTVNTTDEGVTYTFAEPAAPAPKARKTRGQSEKNRLRAAVAESYFRQQLAAGPVSAKSYYEQVKLEEIPYRDLVWVARKLVASGEVTEVKNGRKLSWVAASGAVPSSDVPSAEEGVTEIGA